MAKVAASKTVKAKTAPAAAAAAASKAATKKKSASTIASQKAASTKSSATKSSTTKTSTSKAAARRNANAFLSEPVDEQPASNTTRSRAVFPNRSTIINDPQIRQANPIVVRTTQNRVAVALRPNPMENDEVLNDNRSLVPSSHDTAAPAEISDKLELELQRRENKMLLERLSVLTGERRPVPLMCALSDRKFSSTKLPQV
jgi:hypothetical protein